MMPKLLKRFINFVFPPRCVFCNELLDSTADIHICAVCYKAIPFYSGSAIKHSGVMREDGGCDRFICACHYTGMIKDAIIRYKFFNKPSYYKALAELTSDKIKEMTNTGDFDIIMSVPLHKNKENTRGYNQSLLLSRHISKTLNIAEASDLLCRIKDTHSQSLLDKVQRYANVKDAFKVKDASKVTGRNILLIDDVLTTGCTLDECSRVLKQSGAKEVVGAVIATGRT
jgi:competence protein ComFC